MTPQDPPIIRASGSPAAPDGDTPLAWMSALADGQPDACDAALRAWATDPQARAAWHTLHLSADVLRSEELASDPSHDERFLQSFRERLAQEPVVLAPDAAVSAAAASRSSQAVPVSAARSRRRWWGGAAVAAGFMAVGSVVLMIDRAGRPEAASLAQVPNALRAEPATARVTLPAPAVLPVSTTASSGGAGAAGDPQWRALDGQVLRDAQLDAYLRAHRGTNAVSGRFQTVVLER
jgi:sigma-E factor negative regulatory protein RseA